MPGYGVVPCALSWFALKYDGHGDREVENDIGVYEDLHAPSDGTLVGAGENVVELHKDGGFCKHYGRAVYDEIDVEELVGTVSCKLLWMMEGDVRGDEGLHIRCGSTSKEVHPTDDGLLLTAKPRAGEQRKPHASPDEKVSNIVYLVHFNTSWSLLPKQG